MYYAYMYKFKYVYTRPALEQLILFSWALLCSFGTLGWQKACPKWIESREMKY